MYRIARAWTGFQFEMLIALLCLLSGIPILIGFAPSPTSINNLLPVYAQKLWGGTLTVGGGLTLAGILWREYRKESYIVGLYVERAGLHILSAAVLAYSIAVVFAVGAPSFFTVAIYCAFILACFSRSKAIGKEASIIRKLGR